MKYRYMEFIVIGRYVGVQPDDSLRIYSGDPDPIFPDRILVNELIELSVAEHAFMQVHITFKNLDKIRVLKLWDENALIFMDRDTLIDDILETAKSAMGFDIEKINQIYERDYYDFETVTVNGD